MRFLCVLPDVRPSLHNATIPIARNMKKKLIAWSNIMRHSSNNH